MRTGPHGCQASPESRPLTPEQISSSLAKARLQPSISSLMSFPDTEDSERRVIASTRCGRYGLSSL